MQPLRTCDFCEADALGTFDVVPPELEPTAAERRRVVLCGSCKQRLETLLEPLLARASAPDAGPEADETGSPASGPGALSADDSPREDRSPLETADSGTGQDEDEETGPVVASADDSTEKRRPDRRPNASVSEPAEPDGITPPDDTERQAESQAETAGVTFEESAADRTLEDDSRTSGSDSADGQASDAPASEAVEPAEPAQPGEPDLERRTVAKVTRLLQHRELPIERAAAEELAAGAYDLEDDEVEAIVDWTIERGEFRERDGRLHRA